MTIDRPIGQTRLFSRVNKNEEEEEEEGEDDDDDDEKKREREREKLMNCYCCSNGIVATLLLLKTSFECV